MFKLLTKPSLVKILQQNITNTNIVARFCSAEPRRIEKTINSVTLLGRAGVDPQQRGTEAHPVVTFSLATHNNFKCDNGDWAQRTDWHNVAIFRPDLRESTKNYLTKGQRILVQGRISYGEIKDREGNLRPTTSIIAEDITFFQS